MSELHDSEYAGHTGVERTFDLIRRQYWWPAMRLDIQEYIRTCDSCQKNKSTNQKPAGLLSPLPIPEGPWHSVSIDFIVSLPKSSNKDAIMVVVDRLTKMTVIIPMRGDASAHTVAQLFVQHVARLHGIPESIVSDRDVKFTSAFWKSVCATWGTKQKMSSAYHPQTDGQTERMNRVLEETLRHFVNEKQTNWVELLPMAEFAINNAWNQSIQASPFFLNYGRHPRMPIETGVTDQVQVPDAANFQSRIQDALASAKRALISAQDRQRISANRRRRAVKFEVGEFVLLSTKNLKYTRGLARKLLPRFVGPFEVARTIDKGSETVAAQLHLPPDWHARIHPVFHVSLLRPYRTDGVIQPPPLIHWELSGDEIFELERILDHRGTRRKVTSYYVKWRGAADYYTWEPVAAVATELDAIRTYWDTVVPAEQQHLRPSLDPPVVQAPLPGPPTHESPPVPLPQVPVASSEEVPTTQLPQDPVIPEHYLSPSPSLDSELDGGESVAGNGWVGCNQVGCDPTRAVRS
jgi:transposase InsO family protein